LRFAHGTGGGYTTSGASSSSRSSGGSPADAPSRDVIAQLYQDMLRSAGGDPQLVALRLAEMGFKPADVQEEQQQQQSIKAVGGGAGGLSPWGSLPSKQSLKSNPGACGDAPAVASSIPPLHGFRPALAMRAAACCRPFCRSVCPHPALASSAASAGPPPRGDRDLDGQAAEAGAPSHFFCPVSLQIMRDPVLIAATGQTYDRPCIERWLAAGHCSCPATGVALTPPVSLVPNVALRGSIEDWAEKHAPWLLVGGGRGRGERVLVRTARACWARCAAAGLHALAAQPSSASEGLPPRRVLAATAASGCAAAQDGDRRVKPIPKDEQFGGMPAAGRAGGDADLAFAIQLQQEELQRLAQQRAAVGAAGVAGAGAAPGVAAFGVDSRGAGAPGGGGPGRQRGGAAARRGRGCLRGWLSPTAALLFGATAAYIALFVVSLALNGWNIENLALNPWAGSSPTALMEVGAQEADAVASGGQWWRLLSSPFVSAGVIQLLLNMSCLWTLGRHLEAALAPRPAPAIAATYLLGGWAGALASANLNHYYITCGASAGVCALLGACHACRVCVWGGGGGAGGGGPRPRPGAPPPGAVWADQLLQAGKYVSRLWTALVLGLLTGVYIVMSLLPLMDPWYQAAALLTGEEHGCLCLLRTVERACSRGRGEAAQAAASRGAPCERGWMRERHATAAG
jgi:hypothetical protein